MANQTNNTTPSDEIDLGQLFQLIGRGFQKLFNFFGGIFKSVFHLVILFLLFLQKYFLILSAVVIVGGVVGYFLDISKTPKYISKMVVEPNFNSVQQLYNNIDFYNDLAEAEDSLALSSSLEITITEASSIKKIFVDSYSDENQKIELFDKFISKLDTTTVKSLDFESYLKNFNSLDARFHQISIVSLDNMVAKKIQSSIINSIASNSYFKLQKKISDDNIILQDTIIRNQLIEIDSLQQLYKTVLVKEASKEMQGTNISLGENGESQNTGLALVKERDVLKTRLVQLNQQRANKASILNVISDFPDRGVLQKGFWKSYKFVLPIALLGLTLLILVMISLNRYLKNYNKTI